MDTRDASLRLVDLPASYTFRSLGRGDAGEALVLGTDGALHVIDPESGTVVRSVPVVDAWEEPEEWQEPRPALFVQDGIAYVTDPAGRAIHAVDYVGGEVWKSAELDVVPNELNGVTGKPAAAGATRPTSTPTRTATTVTTSPRTTSTRVTTTSTRRAERGHATTRAARSRAKLRVFPSVVPVHGPAAGTLRP